MNTRTLADHAGQVIVATVSSVRSYWADNPRRIETEVAFEQVEYLKGALSASSSTRTLLVPGGTVGDKNMRICCAPVLKPGEKWLLFLLGTYKTFPVVGLYQGAFRIEADGDGIEKVLSASRRPITGIDSNGFVQVLGGAGQAHDHLVGAVNARLKMDPVPHRAAEAMALQDLLALLRPVLRTSRDHHLTEPAGRRVPIELTPVPLYDRAQSRNSSGFEGPCGLKPAARP